MYAYRMKKTNGGSGKYGCCEVCHGQVDVTYLLAKLKRHTNQDGKESLAYRGTVFGHFQCLASITQRESIPFTVDSVFQADVTLDIVGEDEKLYVTEFSEEARADKLKAIETLYNVKSVELSTAESTSRI